ncbi:MAG: BREX-2 system adenine-specific DNA-methyltransferase PglX [Candidatus Competibacter denitrificans]
MLDRLKLLADLKPLVRALEADLRDGFKKAGDYRQRLQTDWEAARAAGRTAEALEVWAEAQFTQSAVAWVLACLFVRFCEDNGLLDAPLIAGTDDLGPSAAMRQEAFYLKNPTASDNDYLRDVFATAAQYPGLDDVLRVQHSLLDAPVSADSGKQLVRFFRATNPDSGVLLRDFSDADWSTRFLGDLYEDLSEEARKRYALLQTPEFVGSLILDRTLTPALDSYALDDVDVIDPTCGSGHLLLSAFERLAPLWLERHPDNTNLALQAALDRIAGIDINPFAVAIARFRLLVAALKWAQLKIKKLRLAPKFHFHIEIGDSLLHGFDQRDYLRGQSTLGLDTPQENLEGDHVYGHAYATENLEAVNNILARKYTVVVGNPPYITVKDAAISKLYRERFSSCSGKYALVVPFCERFWALAKPSDHTQRGGFVGLIVANSFMKREFGKKLIETFFPKIDLTHLIDTSGAYIPGHGTPTVILFGRNRAPASSTVRAVMGIKGEPATPADPAQGIVWQAILNQIDQRDSESEWVSVTDIPRVTLAKHPWSIGGGGAAELKETIEAAADQILMNIAESIGITSFTLEDNVYVQDSVFWQRRDVPPQILRALVVGDEIRDWFGSYSAVAIFPYDAGYNPIALDSEQTAYRFIWTYRTGLSNSKMFGGQTKVESGLRWFEYGRLTASKLRSPLTITFGEVATHNHFVLDRGGKVFKQTAPVIKLPAEATEDDHLSLLGLLNSSTACFWFKQVCHNKGSTVDQQGARQRTAAFEDFYAFNATKVSQFPLPEQRPLALARTLDDLARRRAAYLPAALFAQTVPTRTELDAARTAAESFRNRMIAWQEELDWQVYPWYGVWDETLCHDGEPPEIRFGERAFEIVLAQQCAAGKTATTWFERHNAQPVTAVPAHWPAAYQAVVERRIDAIRRSRDLALIERPECKRRWSQTDWNTLERAALENWLLDRLEAADLWPRDAHPAPKLRSARELADAVAGDENARRALDLYAGSGSDAHATVIALIQQASVPYLDALRYSDSGLRKRAIWQQVWDLQRREDAIDAAVTQQLAGQPAAAIQQEQVARKAAAIGAIPVPPKYKPEDFRDGGYWKLRGALDVPKERFVRFPGLERASDANSPMLLWAGYDAKARALALAGTLYELLHREGADTARFTPLLAGLDETLPWVQQWHPEIDDDLGMSTGDYLQGLLDSQLAQHGLTVTDLRHWRPPAPVGRKRR